MACWRQHRLDDVYDREMEQQRINQYMDERFERYEQMMKQLTKRMVALIGNQNPVHPIQYYYNRHGYSYEEVSDDKEEENYCEEEYYEQNLFFDTDDGEDEDADIGDEPIFDEEDDGEDEFAAIGDEPIFNEEDENNKECDELLESGDSNIDLVERYQTSKDFGTEIEDHPKREYDMPELVKNVEYIDFIGNDEILYSCVPLTSILKELQVDQKLVLFYTSKNKFLSQYLGKIRREFSLPWRE